MATHLENLEKSGNSKVVREKSGKMEKVRETEICLLDFELAEELKLRLLAACGPGLWICSTLVAISKLVTMLVIINVKQRLFKRYAVYR